MREVNVLDIPNYFPNVCIRCGVGSNERVYYIDLGINLDFYFNPKQEGNIYFCNECWESLVTSVSDKIQIHLSNSFPWEGEGFNRPTYDNKEPLIERKLSSRTVTTIDPIPTVDYNVPDSTDTDPIGAVQTAESAVPDAEDESVREFRGFFGTKS